MTTSWAARVGVERTVVEDGNRRSLSRGCKADKEQANYEGTLRLRTGQRGNPDAETVELKQMYVSVDYAALTHLHTLAVIHKVDGHEAEAEQKKCIQEVVARGYRRQTSMLPKVNIMARS